MKITILTMGSRGDVQPYVALGNGLRDAGHKVRVCTHKIFKEFVTDHGHEFMPLRPEDPFVFLSAEIGQKFMSGGRIQSMIGSYYFFKSFNTILGDMLDDCLKACEGSDLVINSVVCPGHAVSNIIKAPFVIGGLWPTYPTSEYAHPAILLKLGKLFNLLSYAMLAVFMMRAFGKQMNEWGAKRGLPKLVSITRPLGNALRREFPWILGFSPSVVPRAKDWPGHIHVTGYWFLEDKTDWQPSKELVDFLEAGQAPIYFGFGSVVKRDGGKLLSIIKEALKEINQRAIIYSGKIKSEEILSNSVLNIGPTPHSWLFPRMRAIVHHGGAGTTSASLRAGVPVQLIPFDADQFFWGDIVHKLGNGPKPIPYRKLTVEKLVKNLNIMLDNEKMQDKAKEISRKIQQENGVKKAVEVIEEYYRNYNT